jgi:hypothetical protein
MKRRMPGHRVLLVAHVASEDEALEIASLAANAGLDGIDLNADAAIVTPRLIVSLHERSMLAAVWVWRAPASNDVPAVWRAMAAAGVDVFTSNVPPELLVWRQTTE